MSEALSLDTSIPVPKYKIGDVIWQAYTERKTAQHDCPDCLGSKKWECTTPAGTTLTIDCQRCSNRYGQTDNIPSLKYQAWAPVVRPLTIKSIQINAGPQSSFTRDAVTYYDSPGCCGTYVTEARVIATEEDAQSVAHALAQEANDKEASTPERLEARHYASLVIDMVAVKKARDDVWSAWTAYRFLSEEVEKAIDEESGESARDRLEDLSSHMDYERKAKTCREYVVAMDAIMARALKEFPAEMFADIPDTLKVSP